MLTKHLSLWKEIPAGTEWHEVNINEHGLDYIRVFPRAHWRKLARGDFSVSGVAAGLRANPLSYDDRFLSKIADLRNQLAHQDVASCGTVILLGVGEFAPFTVLDGNHRLIAATLSAPHCFSKLRLICGFSPRMTECCWYETNAVALFRYARNVMARAICNSKSERERLMHDSGITTRMVDTAEAALVSAVEANDVQS